MRGLEYVRQSVFCKNFMIEERIQDMELADIRPGMHPWPVHFYLI